METVEAGDAEIPALGLGTFQLSDEACRRAVQTALDAGYRHVDTAEMYDNERAVGEGLNAAAVDRDEVFLTTKVWRSNLRRDDVRPAVEASVDRLGVEYVDLVLVHWPHPRIPVEGTMAALADLHDEGLVRHVGVSNFTRSQLAEARSVADVPIVTDQVLYHPYKDQSELLAYCREHDVALTAYSPLARGSVLNDETLSTIGDRHDRTAVQVALRWLIEQDGVVAIPRSSSERHIEENLAAFDFELTDDDRERIDGRSGSLRVRLRDKLPAVMRRFPL